MMSEPMSDERLVDLRRDVMSQVASAGGSTRHSDAYTEMLDEIDRLRAENERQAKALTGSSSLNPFRYIARLSWTNPYVIWDTGNPHCHFCMSIPDLGHEKGCLWADAVRLATELRLEEPVAEPTT